MVVGVWRDVVERLTPVPLAERQGFLTLPPTREAHAAAHASVAAFHQIERRQPTTPAASANSIRIAAWNLERCLYPDEAARVLQRNHVDIALLTEMDVGVLRTGQAHTIGRIAAQLGHGYCYGCEFLELLPMAPPPGFPRNGSDNAEGYHGNGLVASLPMQDPDRHPPRRDGGLVQSRRRPAPHRQPHGHRCHFLRRRHPLCRMLGRTSRTAPTAPAARDRCGRCSTRWMPMPGQGRW